MRVLVTGGSGRLGRWVIHELLEHGHEAINADQRPPAAEEGLRSAPFRQTDLGDVGQVTGAMRGCDGVIHLGAIPAPWRHADEFVFGNNTRATFATLQAALLLGVRKAVFASSVSALGMAWTEQPFYPLYAPIDEAHPLLPRDPYGLSKEVDERTAEMFHRRTGMQVLAYRFHWVAAPGEAARTARDTQAKARSHSANLWGYVDVRDAAQACRLGMEVTGLGFEAFNIIAADTLREEPTEELIRQYCPEVEIRQPIPGVATAWSIDKARRLLGYAPRHSWRDETARD